MKLGLISLGCDKATVDSERMLAALVGNGAEHTADLSRADIILVNTCAFIDAAREESIETILDAARWKKVGRCRALVAAGCLVERYREQLEPELPEVDLFVGLQDMARLVPELRARGLLDRLADHPGTRLPLRSGRHVSYLKVSEGCDHGCAFCAIPLWRGRHRSFAAEALIEEARTLEAQGVVELALVAQDLAHFGRDRRDPDALVDLLRGLIQRTDIPWFRLLYIYSAGLRAPLVELTASEPRILPYLDVPIQHASDAMLARMRRPERQQRLREKIRWLRESIPGLVLRTTVMVGFPGETDDDFRELLDFMEEVRFDRLGAFAFSPQPGTRAADMEELMLPPEVGRERLEELLEVQRAISAERMSEEVGRRHHGIVDRIVDGVIDRAAANGRNGEPFEAVGRVAGQADDVDGTTTITAPFPLAPGTLVELEITAADDFDLEGRALRVVRVAPRLADGGGSQNGSMAAGARPQAPSQTARRRLPLAPLGLDTAWGR